MMLEYLTVDPKNLTFDPAWIAGVNSVNFGVNSEIYKNHTIDPSYSGRVNSEINCCNTFDGPDGIKNLAHRFFVSARYRTFSLAAWSKMKNFDPNHKSKIIHFL